MLDLGLLFPDTGRDNFRIQEPREDMESLTLSSPELSFCPFSARISDHLRAAPFCVGESSFGCEGRRRNVKELGGAGEDPTALERLRLSGVTIVELVPGRETIEGVFKVELSPSAAMSPTFLFLDEGRGGVDSSGLPNARPVAAMPTVLVATSYKEID